MKVSDKIFVYPTDTVWGIGSSIYSKAGYNKILEIKNVSSSRHMSIMFSSIHEFQQAFTLPTWLDKNWAKKFFALESTIAIPLKHSRITIPPWITQESKFVAVRCLEYDCIQHITQEVAAPITTTSLNKSGAPPIICYEKAAQFIKQHKFTLHLVPSRTVVPSGLASSIVALEEDRQQQNIKFIRLGAYAKEIEALMKIKQKL
ncbi:MAG: Sua5/YciO/YrdC/YwlC family protein [Bacteriovoracaceae bacterium]|nr:Sua5/YciO/YrdC/YwlC family protein [Bacteriovoracaceae bacterium]